MVHGMGTLKKRNWSLGQNEVMEKMLASDNTSYNYLYRISCSISVPGFMIYWICQSKVMDGGDLRPPPRPYRAIKNPVHFSVKV